MTKGLVGHVGLLEAWNSRREGRAAKYSEEDLPELEDEQDEWEVEDIVAHDDSPPSQFYCFSYNSP